ncbi:MAG: hypothetical protein V2I97_05140 [Desulfococcaceae bacterium]|jgi:hypothetical protein|nr:hypothetical protein [Desulfococcaceae bacterium]
MKLFMHLQLILHQWKIMCHTIACNECVDGILVCDEGWKLRMKHAMLRKRLWQMKEMYAHGTGKKNELFLTKV